MTSKRMRAIHESIDRNKVYTVDQALTILKNMKEQPKFRSRIDVAVVLGVDPKKSDQVVRGATLLPNGSGKTVRVAVMAQGPKADEAKNAGADRVGFEDLVDYIKAQDAAGGKFDFDVLIATPDSMRLIGQIGRVLGPRGLMPNPKVGTVTMNVGQAVKDAKAGQATYRADKGGIVHCAIGVVDFEVNALKENLFALVHDLRRAKPSTAKGTYFKKIVLSSTMGPGLVVDLSGIPSAL